MNDRVLLDRAQKCLGEWQSDAEEKAKPGKPKEHDDRVQEHMRMHKAEMDDILPGLRERRDQLQAERESDAINETGPPTKESDDELEELDEIISTFDLYV